MPLIASERGAATAAIALAWTGRTPACLSDDELAARSLATVGATGLVSLPLLLTASSLVDAPLGAPAAIAMGYLVAAWSLHLGKNGIAMAWGLAVPCGLVLWTILYGGLEAGTLSWTESTAVLLAPAFAAAPALVRRALAPMQNRVPAALSRDERAQPARQDRDEARRPPERAENHAGLASTLAAPLPTHAAAKPGCDLGGAIAFALRRAGTGMRARDICLLRQQSSSLAVACDPPLCRQIVTTLLDCAVAASPAGGILSVEARGLKGAVLFRLTVEGSGSASEKLGDLLARTRVQGLVDGAGGTLITGSTGKGASVTLRLASAPDGPAQCSAKYAGGA